MHQGYQWLKQTQIREELEGREHEARDHVVGGYCFSAGDERWPVSDCTAEALTSVLSIHDGQLAPKTATRFSDGALRDAAEFILSRQNDDGGFGTYERRRTPLPLDVVNPSEMYGDCMSERSFVECSASCVNALASFLRSSVLASPELRQRCQQSIARAVAAIRSRQLPDGSFAGTWGINFIFGTFHAIDALRAADVPGDDPALQQAARWLVGKQKPDGGWGEHWRSSLQQSYVEHAHTQATMTAWALLGLLHVLEPSSPPVRRGIAALLRLQQPDGSWPHQSQAGVFFTTCVLDYLYYKDYFPTWALATYARATGQAAHADAPHLALSH
jgi:lanosterol synthase